VASSSLAHLNPAIDILIQGSHGKDDPDDAELRSPTTSPRHPPALRARCSRSRTLARRGALGSHEGMFYLVLVIAVVIGVDRSRKRIEQVEGTEGHRPGALPRGERWKQATRVEKAAFIVMAMSAVLWLLLILPIGFTAAVIALGVAVWKRPYLEATLAPVAIVGGVAIALYDVVMGLVRDDGGWGALLTNVSWLGGPWIIIGLLLKASAPPTDNHTSEKPSAHHGVRTGRPPGWCPRLPELNARQPSRTHPLVGTPTPPPVVSVDKSRASSCIVKYPPHSALTRGQPRDRTRAPATVRRGGRRSPRRR